MIPSCGSGESRCDFQSLERSNPFRKYVLNTSRCHAEALFFFSEAANLQVNSVLQITMTHKTYSAKMSDNKDNKEL